jgi:outer membrane immunogenic protein
MKLRTVGGLAISALLIATPLSIASAADMALKAPPPPPAPVNSWTGCYLGINGGGAWAKDGNTLVNFTSDGYDLGPNFHNNTASSFVGGFQGGCNYQAASWVLGVEGDFDWTSLKHSNSGILLAGGIPFGVSLTSTNDDLKWLASARARLGYAFGNFMPYVTGGAAWSDTTFNGFVTNNLLAPGTGPGPYSANQIRSGYVVGGGIEYMATHNWLLRAEYLYYGFGGETFVGANNPSFVPGAAGVFSYSRENISVLRAGLSYKFN